MPVQQSYRLGLGLAAGSVGLDLPLIDDKLGLRFTGNRSFTDLMLRVNGHRSEFTTTPRGHDGNLNLVYKYSPTGRLKLFSFNAGDRIGVRVVEPSFDGQYRDRTDNYLHNVQWTDVWADWFIQTSASLNRYTARRQLGSLDLTPPRLDRQNSHRLGTRTSELSGSCASVPKWSTLTTASWAAFLKAMFSTPRQRFLNSTPPTAPRRTGCLL